MNISRLSVRRPVTTIITMILVLLLGFVSFTNLKVDLFPAINPPILAILTTYPGAAPNEVTEMVTKPIEDQVGTVQGIKTIQSQSSTNSSLVIAEFDWGTNLSEVREEIDSRLSMLTLPEDVMKPSIVKFDPTSLPVLQFSISSEKSLQENQQLVEDVLIPQLQSIDGVANVTHVGGFNEEIKVSLDEEKIKKYGLTQSNIVGMIQGNNLTYPGGVIEGENQNFDLVIASKVDSLETLKALPITIDQRNGSIVLLKDIAEVKMAPKSLASIARTDGNNSIVVSIQKEGTANTSQMAKKVREKLSQFEKNQQGTKILIAQDQGEMIDKSVQNVALSLIFGALFSVLVIFAFLRSISSTFIIAIAIPFSVITTFVLMYFSHITLNIISLGGLALGVGMLVDNAIVVIENINRHISLGKRRKEAAVEGAQEVASAITASTLTTVSVFVPIVFLGDFVGELFRELSLTVTFSILASLVVSLTVIPTLAALLLKEKKQQERKPFYLYQRLLRWSLQHRLVTLGLAILLLVGSIVLVPHIGTELLPAQDEGTFTANIELPAGTKIQKTLQVVEKVEAEAMKIKEIQTVATQIGNEDALMASMMGASDNVATMTFKLVENKERSQSTKEIATIFEEKIKDMIPANGELSVKESNSMEAMMGSSDKVQVLLTGQQEAQLHTYMQALQKELEKIEGVTEVTTSLEEGKEQFQFNVNQEEALKYGLTGYSIADYIRNQVQGQVATKISKNGMETDVRIQMDRPLNALEDLEKVEFVTPMGQTIQLKEVGEVISVQSPITNVREAGRDAVTIDVAFEKIDFGTAMVRIQQTIDSFIKEHNVNTGLYDMKLAGSSETMTESFWSLFMSMLLAIALVYGVMASQFESLKMPFIIMFSLPLAIIGVILGLFFTGYAFGITAFIGIIVLVGIVVNNAIVLIDYTNRLRSNGKSVDDALIEAGVTRLRPIMMTVLTTILGLLPLAVGTGEGTELQAPMAIAVIGGLITSTLLTLIIVPVLYSLFERRIKKQG